MKDLPIKSVWWTSLIDWPGCIASVIFIGGCNFRCVYCHNPELVLSPKKMMDIKKEVILKELEKRRRFIDGVVFSGGEATLFPLEDLLKKIKSINLKIAIETNGSNPLVLKRLFRSKLLDAIFMDIKGSPKQYEHIIGRKIDRKKIQKSIDFMKKLAQSSFETEFRTTVAPGLIDEKEIQQIGQWLGPDCPVPYCLQQFQNQKTLNDNFQKIKPYPKEKLERMAKIAQRYFRKVRVRN